MSIQETENFLSHYGVKGMHWGTRRETIRAARKNQAHLKVDQANAEANYKKQTTDAGKAAALKELKKKEFANWENKQVANTATRGEQIAIGVLSTIALTPIGALAVVGAVGAHNRDSKKFKSKYPEA